MWGRMIKRLTEKQVSFIFGPNTIPYQPSISTYQPSISTYQPFSFMSLILVHVCTLYTTVSCDQASQLP
jgi:hypothetical protein